MKIKIYPKNPDLKAVRNVVDILENDGVIIYPTDTVYALGCSLKSPKAIEKIKSIKGKKQTDMSIICPDISSISKYAKFDTPTFKLLKQNFPGPFTFILKATNKIPDKFLEKRKNIGIRMPENEIVLSIVQTLDYPLVTTSVKDDDQIIEYTTDPELIEEKYSSSVDIIVDGGYGNNEPSTIVDCTGDEPEIIRQGIGELK
ncbi:MAG: threonylcarbamoyl-AMP synthase [Rikenellaceae bacterium]|nr:threonylcarbamoyl-AMP synthase [Rikenellaceae bacterium]